MSISKISLILIYLALLASIVYNIFSYNPYLGLGAEIRKTIGSGYNVVFEVRNQSKESWKDVVVLLNNNYIVYYDEIKGKDFVNVYLFEFLPINYRPDNASKITFSKYESRDDIIKKLNETIDQKAEIELFTNSGHFYKKLN
ncbi:hypothetical protein JXR93_07985 [bacterium]|nr:hypothetical protein [bacterium]